MPSEVKVIPPKRTVKAGPAKLCIAYDNEGGYLCRRRTLRAMLAFAADYAKPCMIKTSAGRILFLNQTEGH